MHQITLTSHAARRWGIIAATETDLAFIKKIGWFLAIYATALFSLLQVYTLGRSM